MNELIKALVIEQSRASAQQLTQIINHAAAAPFCDELLEVDQPLWGGFWHGDVIAPGYRLPALELALLRAIRLDQNWPPAAGPDQFLADLRRAIRHPRAGLWTLAAAGHPCALFAAPTEKPQSASRKPQAAITIVWYCATTGQLHSGYRTTGRRLYLGGAIEQRQPGFARPAPALSKDESGWLRPVIEQIEVGATGNLAARLDAEILRRRAGRPAGEH